MTDTPETDTLARGNHVVPTEFAQQLERERDDLIASLNFHAGLNKDLIRERDEAIRSCHIWQKGHAELVAERDYLLNLLQVNQTIKPDPEELQLIAKTAIICAQIYIARNISLSEKDVLSALTEIDKLYREENHN